MKQHPLKVTTFLQQRLQHMQKLRLIATLIKQELLLLKKNVML